ncbi:MAG: potassium channel family protein [Pseudomonadota bacterium]|nr:potassium channel family protein [Pseudomonadota bacterium]
MRLQTAAMVLAAIVLLGTAGFYGLGPSDVSITDALYMTLITITTVGYDEVIPIETLTSRIFTGLISISGFGTLTFLFTSLSVLFLERDLDETLRRRHVEHEIKKLSGHYLICGFGRVGRNVGRELKATHRHFVAVDPDETMLKAQLERFPGLLYLAGDASDDDLLFAACIENARGVFAVTGDDSLNLMIALTSKQLNPKARVVARCQEVRNAPKLRKAGADAIVSPDFTGGMRIASAMVRPHTMSFFDEMLRTEEGWRIEEIPLPESTPTFELQRLPPRSEHYMVVAVSTDKDLLYNPSPQQSVSSGDTLIVIASPEGRARVEQAINAFNR